MSSGVSILHQTGALFILALGSLAIAMVPLSLLHVVYRKKRRRLREDELLKRSQTGSVHPELNITPSNHINHEQTRENSNGSFMAGWFGFENRWAQHRPSRDSARTLSSRSSNASSLYQHVSEVALASTLAIPSIVLELIRSLDGGLLLGALFLILLPQLRSTFDAFMQMHVQSGKTTSTTHFQTLPLLANGTFNLSSLIDAHHAARKAEAEAQSAQLVATKTISPVPLVELILCLAFFALHFTEEFAQLCFRYRKYFWACNSAVVYSSSNGTCELSSLDYRISRTKRFLIDCSRKTSSTSGSTTTSSPSHSPTAATANAFVVTEATTKVDTRTTEGQTEAKTLAESSAGVSASEEATLDELDQVVENHNLQDSLQLYPQSGQHQGDFEPNSLLSTSSSSYLPSYYWPPVQSKHRQPGAQVSVGGREFYNESEQVDSLPYGPEAAQHNHHPHQGETINGRAQASGGTSGLHPPHFCCPCRQQPYAYHQTAPSDSGSGRTSCSTSSSSPGGVFTKIFLPYTTLATSTPALYFCEGILIAIQPSAAMLWLMLAVILVHKLVTGLLVSFELHEKTTGRQRQLPPPTTFLFTVLPLAGYLTVLLINGFFVLRQQERQATAVVSGTEGASTVRSSTSSSTDHSPIEMAAIRVILVAVASATVLHLVLLIIQRNLAHFQPQLQFRKSKAQLGVHLSSVGPFHQQQPQQHLTASKMTSNSNPSPQSKNNLQQTSNSNKEPSSSLPTATLSQVPMCAMSSQDPLVQTSLSGPQLTVNLDPEIVTNPPRYGVLHHFTMYTGFILVLMAIAFLNMKSFKI